MTATHCPDPGRPKPVTNLRCRRCGGRDHVFVPATGRVRCVDCTVARSIDRMARSLAAKRGTV